MRLIANLGAGLALAGFFQMPSTPPMKLGLWESNSTLTMAIPGMQGPGRPPVVVKSRSCLTADTWAKAFADSGRAGVCTHKSETYGGGHLKFDMVCPNGTGHGDMQFDTTAMHGKIHMAMKSPRGEATTDMVIESHFVSAACGAVKPGAAEILQ